LELWQPLTLVTGNLPTEDTEAAGKDELALSSCPGIEIRTDYSINLLPLFSALSTCLAQSSPPHPVPQLTQLLALLSSEDNNMYFTGLSLSSIAGRREAVALLASALEHNTHLQRVTLSGLDAQPDAYAFLPLFNSRSSASF
jgi:hypothetical protein